MVDDYKSVGRRRIASNEELPITSALPDAFRRASALTGWLCQLLATKCTGLRSNAL